MNSLHKRIVPAERALGVGQKPMVVKITWFGDEPIPPEEQRDNLILRYVAYKNVYGGLLEDEGCTGNEE